MGKLLVSVLLVAMLAVIAAAGSQKCATTSVNVSATQITFGESIQITGHFTNCGSSNLQSVSIKVFVRNPCLVDSSGGVGYNNLYTSFVDIAPGQTVDVPITFTPNCNDSTGQWEAETYMRPRGNTQPLEASADFTVNP